MAEYDLTGLNVAISVPCYKGTVPMDWVCSFSATQAHYAAHGVKSFLQVRMNSGLIHAVRNELVHTALQRPEVTHILFIDDDIIWKPDDALRLLAWGTKFPFVCGVYPARMDEPTFFVELMPTKEGKIWQNEDGLIRAKGVPAGFMMLRRDVFESPKMKAQCPITVPSKGDLKDELVHGYFDYIHEGLSGCGEDIAMGRRWLRAGGEIWVDPSIQLQHVGTKSFSHSYVEFLKANAL